MEGGISNMEVVAIRIKSDITTPRDVDGKGREDWFCAYPGLFMGLILLFSAKDGALLAILHDAHIQHMRVAATHAIGTKYMARKDARVMGILGSGGMAWTHALTFPKVRPIERIKVYSPNPEHRRRFAAQASELAGIPVEAMDSAEPVVRGSDIVCGCTNAIEPVVMGDWLEPGMHLTFGKRDEPDEQAYRRADRYVAYESPPGIQGVGQDSFFTYQPEPKHLLGVKGGILPERQREILSWLKEHKDHPLSSVIRGEVAGRDNDRQITFMVSEGSGVQFAALSSLVYEAAKKRGLGRKLPLIWFLQDVTN
jgi:ornithine cyclodeaminase/alanine dehydrogenase-like protein (mu-crystallin family)